MHRSKRHQIQSPNVLEVPAVEGGELAAAQAGRLGLLLGLLAELADRPEGLSRSLSRLTFTIQEGERHQAGIERVIRHVLEHYAEPGLGRGVRRAQALDPSVWWLGGSGGT